MRIIVTGGTGLIGRALSKALVADGNEVIILTRNPGQNRPLPPGITLDRKSVV